jgi:hypothetical protein
LVGKLHNNATQINERKRKKIWKKKNARKKKQIHNMTSHVRVKKVPSGTKKKQPVTRPKAPPKTKIIRTTIRKRNKTNKTGLYNFTIRKHSLTSLRRKRQSGGSLAMASYAIDAFRNVMGVLATGAMNSSPNSILRKAAINRFGIPKQLQRQMYKYH